MNFGITPKKSKKKKNKNREEKRREKNKSAEFLRGRVRSRSIGNFDLMCLSVSWQEDFCYFTFEKPQ